MDKNDKIILGGIAVVIIIVLAFVLVKNQNAKTTAAQAAALRNSPGVNLGRNQQVLPAPIVNASGGNLTNAEVLRLQQQMIRDVADTNRNTALITGGAGVLGGLINAFARGESQGYGGEDFENEYDYDNNLFGGDFGSDGNISSDEIDALRDL